MGKPRPSFLFLQNQAAKITRGAIQIVLATLRVAATSTDVSPTLDAAPTTEAVSCIAKAAQAPNCFSLKLNI